MIPGIEALACGELAVPAEVMAHVVQVESSRNPYAIGVVGGRLQRQPSNLAEAVATVEMLERGGHNYSVGLAQVNRANFRRFGLDVPEQAFDVCINLRTGAQILAECLRRHDGRWGDAFSCYYSGNAETGYHHGYVQKVFASMGVASPAGMVIPLAGSDGEPTPPGHVPAHVAARVSAADASRRLPLRADPAPAELRATEASIQPSGMAAGTAVGANESVTGLPPEEAFLRMARARMTSTPAAAATSTPTPPTPAPVVEIQESSKLAEDPARVF